MNMNFILQIINTFFSVYFILIFITIILSWLPHLRMHPLAQMVLALTSPYLNFFRRFGLQFGGFDFSIILAYAFLVFVQRTLNIFLATGRFSVVTVLLFLSDIFFSVLSVFFTIIAIFSLIRFISVTFMRSNGPFSVMLDHFLRKPIAVVGSLFARRRVVRYTTLLIILMISTFIISRGINFLHAYTNYLISQIPL